MKTSSCITSCRFAYTFAGVYACVQHHSRKWSIPLEKGLKAIAITITPAPCPVRPAHGSLIPCMNCRFYTAALLLIAGMEANVIDLNGTLDINETERRDVNWLVRPFTISDCRGLRIPRSKNARSFGSTLRSKVNVIGHSGSPGFRYDCETVGVRSKPQACGD